VDREKTCPLLLRVYTKRDGFHKPEEFEPRRRETLQRDETLIYTWKDATLRELTDLVKQVDKAATFKGARVSLAFVYPDKSGHMVQREVGQCFCDERRTGPDDAKTLDELHFETGDYLDAAIFSR